MFVRWKMTKRANGNVMHTAQLVETVRVEGKPRQKVIAHLGSYTHVVEQPRYNEPARIAESERSAGANVMNRAFFWRMVEKHYCDRVPEAMRANVRAALAVRVPPTTEEDRETFIGTQYPRERAVAWDRMMEL